MLCFHPDFTANSPPAIMQGNIGGSAADDSNGSQPMQVSETYDAWLSTS